MLSHLFDPMHLERMQTKKLENNERGESSFHPLNKSFVAKEQKELLNLCGDDK